MRLVGAKVLVPTGLTEGELSIAGGKIVEGAERREVNLAGFLVLPGMIDLHGDGFERHIAPRRGAMRDLGVGLASVDAELAANGISTAMLAQFFSWEGGMRGRAFAERFCGALGEARSDLLTDMRLQLRLETHLLDDFDRFEALVAKSGAQFVVFNDHLPHDALAKGKRPPRLTGQALKSGRSPEAHLTMLQAMHARGDEVPEAVAGLAKRLMDNGVLLGSHDDNTPGDRAEWRARGARVCEFPETREAAEAARKGGDLIVLGAPNVVRGNSHKGNVSARDLVAEGLCDALASDYHYPALIQAVWRLVTEGIVTLEEGWALVSSGPAAVLGLEDRGVIAAGRRADLVVLDPDTGRVGATIVEGRVSFMAGEVAARFLAA